MTLDQYLEQFIEGYLLADLRSMAPIRLAPDKLYGAVGYPMVMSVLSGIEVLGVLTSRARFDKEQGPARFSEFWKQYTVRRSAARQRLDSLMYHFIRHGLAHSYMTKPMVRITKDHDRGHLTRTAGDIISVDALTLADDFDRAYRQGLRPKIVGELRAKWRRVSASCEMSTGRNAKVRATRWRRFP